MRNILLRLGFVLAAALAVTHCAAVNGADPVPAGEVLEIRGEIVHVGLEGGFWGIVGEDGRRYSPGRLPPEFQQPGLRVSVTARAERARVSFRMWGTPITIERIEHAAP